MGIPKITHDLRMRILKLRYNGTKLKDLPGLVGISRSAIYRILFEAGMTTDEIHRCEECGRQICTESCICCAAKNAIQEPVEKGYLESLEPTHLVGDDRARYLEVLAKRLQSKE